MYIQVLEGFSRYGFNWGGRSMFGPDVVAVLFGTRNKLIIPRPWICSPPCSLDVSLAKCTQELEPIQKHEFDSPCVCLHSTSHLEVPGHHLPRQSYHSIATKSCTQIHPSFRTPSSRPCRHIQQKYCCHHAGQYSSYRRSRSRSILRGIARNGISEADVNLQRNLQ